MTKKTCLLLMAMMTASLYGQSFDMKIINNDGDQITISTETITKIDFVTDRTYALRILQSDGELTETNLTDIDKIAFAQLTTSVQEKSQSNAAPKTFLLRQNYPNPFNPTTTIEYELSSPGMLQIQILNTKGQVVRSLESGYFPAGIHRTAWNGKNNNEQVVTSGVYFYRVAFNNAVQIKKLLLVR